MSIGPISYRDVMFYADELSLNDDTRDFLWDVIEKVDTAYLRAINDKLEDVKRK